MAAPSENRREERESMIAQLELGSEITYVLKIFDNVLLLIMPVIVIFDVNFVWLKKKTTSG